MKPVAIAIMAAVLPTGLMIVGLVCLVIYLYSKLRALRLENKRLLEQLHLRPLIETAPLTEEQTAPEEKARTISRAEESSKEPHLSDAADPDWKRDIYSILHNLESWGGHTNLTTILGEPEDDHKFKETLKALQYKGDVSPDALVKLLRLSSYARSVAVEYIVVSIGFGRTSIDSDPESTLLPFSSDVQMDLKRFFNTIKGIKFCPEISSIIANIPTQVAVKAGGVNRERMEKTIDLLDLLLRPVANMDWLRYPHSLNHRGRAFDPVIHKRYSKGLFKSVLLQMRMLGSPEQLKLE